MSKLPKKFFDPEEAKMMADIDLLPLSRLLYMTLRLCHGIHDSGIGIVRINEMVNMTGIDRACITEVLLPELKRNDLVYYDNTIIFMPQIPIAEGFNGKITGRRKTNDETSEKKEDVSMQKTWMHKKSFVNHLTYLESNPKNLKSDSQYGGMNTAILKAFELLDDEVNELVQYLMLQEELLLSADSSNEKEIRILQKNINDYYASSLLIMYKNQLSGNQNSTPTANFSQAVSPAAPEKLPNSFETVSQNTPNPFETLSKPFRNPFKTPYPKTANPSEPLSKPFQNTLPKNAKEYMVNGYMVNGYMVKNEEDSFLKIAGEGVGEPSEREIFSPPVVLDEGLITVEVDADTTTDEPEQPEMTPVTGSSGLHLLVDESHTELNLKGTISNKSKALHGKSIIDDVLRSDEMVPLNTLDGGAEGGNSEFLGDGENVKSGFG